MTRTVPAAILTAIQSSAFKLPQLVHIRRSDNIVHRFTNWDVAITTDMADETTSPDPTYYPNKIEGLSTFSAQINAPVDDTELLLAIDDDEIIANDARRGRFDSAIVTIGYALPDSPVTSWLYAKYDTGQVKIEGIRLRIELLGPEKRLEQPVFRVLTSNCPWVFGDVNCGIPTRVLEWEFGVYPPFALVRPTVGASTLWFRALNGGATGVSEPTWPLVLGGTVVDNGITWEAIYARRTLGIVGTVSSRKVFTASGISIASDYFGEGYLTWTTGDNDGDVHRVSADDGIGGLTLHKSAFEDIQVGDTFAVVAGCRKRLLEDCVTKWDNETNSRTHTLRFGGFPYLAEEDVTVTSESSDEESEEDDSKF